MFIAAGVGSEFTLNGDGVVADQKVQLRKFPRRKSWSEIVNVTNELPGYSLYFRLFDLKDCSKGRKNGCC